jgi:hypothetical protein
MVLFSGYWPLSNEMTWSFNSARPIAVGRGVVPWVVGPVALLIRGRPLELASPSACPGLLELMSIASVRLDPDLGIGLVFVVLRAAAIVVGLAAFVELVYRRTRHMELAAATGLAVGLSPLFASTLSPPWEAAAFAVCAVGALLFGPFLDWQTRSPGLFTVASLCVFLAAALLVPPWLVLAAAATFLTVGDAAARGSFRSLGLPERSGRWAAGAVAAAGLSALAIAILSLSRPGALAGLPPWRALASCTLPWPSPAPVLAAARTIGWALGPLALALAALGLFGEAQQGGWRRPVLAAGVAIVCLGLAAGAGLSPLVAMAPAAVGLWWLAASGLRDLVTAIGRKPVLRFTSALVLVLLPTLEASRLGAEERDDWVRPHGHEKTTLRQMRAVLSQVSSRAVFVEEDSTTDVLLGASIAGRRRTSRSLTIVPPQSEKVSRALESGAVYVFPRQQENLSRRGFTIEPLAVTVFSRDNVAEKIGGVATIVATRQCRVIGTAWVDLGGAGTQGRIAMAADAETARGPMTIYLGGAMAAQPLPDGWPPRTTRGFVFGLFDQREGKRSDRLTAEARTVGLPTGHAALAEPFVVRLTLHRTPRAPLALAVALGASFPFGVARLEQDPADRGQLTVCDAPPVEIRPLGPE